MIKLQIQEKIAPHFEAQSLCNDVISFRILLLGVHSYLDDVVALEKDILYKLANLGGSNLVNSLFVTSLSVDVLTVEHAEDVNPVAIAL